MKKIMFVCTGNTCRSPMAEGLFRLYCEQNHLDFTVDSCGLMAMPGDAVSEYALQAALALGADISTHRAKAFSPYMLDEVDLFVCMTRSHKNILLQLVPDEKIYVLANGVSDPYGGDLETYQACAVQMQGDFPNLVAVITGDDHEN